MPDVDTLLSIGEVAAATGISAETLRMWERRYGRPQAVRLPSGHRRYTQDHLRWLRRVAEALARGNRPHRVVHLPEGELDVLLAGGVDGDATDRRVLLDLARSLDAPGLLARLRAGAEALPTTAWLAGEVAGFLQAVGRAWADGDLEIRHEHFVSEVLVDLLRSLRLAYALPERTPRVLLTTLSGETHGLGLQMAALVCASRGVPAQVLGVDTPNEQIGRAVAEGGIVLVGVGVSLATGGVETDRTLAALRALLPKGVRLVVGGQGARGVRRGPRGIEYAQDLAAWDALLADLA